MLFTGRNDGSLLVVQGFEARDLSSFETLRIADEMKVRNPSDRCDGESRTYLSTRTD